jgi:hypothetical protein
VFFKKLFNMEEVTGTPSRPEHHVKSISQYPFDALYNPKVQAAPIVQIENPNYWRFKSDAGAVVHRFSLNRLGSKRHTPDTLSRLSNLYLRWSSQVSGFPADGLASPLSDVCGQTEVQNVHPQTNLRTEQVAKLVAEYQSGETVRGLARKHGLHRGTVVRRLHGAGVSTGQQKFAADTTLVQKVRTLRGMGLTIRQVADEAGISHQSALRLLAE